MADYNRAIALDPLNYRGYFRRGKAYSDQDRTAEAIADFTKAIDLNEGYALAYFSRACKRRKLGEYEAAISDYDAFLHRETEHAGLIAMAYRCKAYTNEILHSFEQAVADYTQEIHWDPKSAFAYLGRSRAQRDLATTSRPPRTAGRRSK